MTAELNEIRELRRDIQDLVVGIDGIGFQLERICAIERTRATYELGDDPLGVYYERLLDDPDSNPQAPPWVNEGTSQASELRYAPPERANEGVAAALVFSAVMAGIIVFALFTLYFIGQP